MKKNADLRVHIDEGIMRERDLSLQCQTLNTQNDRISKSLEKVQQALNNLESD